MRKHETPKSKIATVFILTIVIFLFGVLLGNYFTQSKFDQIFQIEESLRVQTAGAELQYLLVVNEPCKYINSTGITDELYDISERVDYMENQRGENDVDVLRLKNTYSLLELRHWLFIKKTNNDCKTKFVPVLYFYSNTGDCPKCTEQGYTLTYLRKKYPELMVYSFDVNIRNPAVDTIKASYGVEGAPTVVFPDRTLHFSSYEEIDVLLSGTYNLTARK